MLYKKFLQKIENDLKISGAGDDANPEHDRYLINNKNYQKVLIKNIPYIFTCDKDEKLLCKKGFSIEIEAGVIKKVFKAKDINQKYYDLIYDASKRGGVIVTPGLINTHAHIHMYHLRSAMMLDEGEGVDQAIADMAVWQKSDTDEQMAYASVADLTEQQKFGITTTLTQGPSFNAHEAAARATHHNLINAVSAVSNSRPSNNPEMVKKIFEKKSEYFSIPAVSLHYLYKTKISELREIKEMIDENNSLLTFHMAESDFVVKQTLKKHKLREVKLLETVGLLNDRSIASHVLHVNDSEIKRMAESGMGIAHLPTSNTIHKSGIFPIFRFMKVAGSRKISLGTDSVISKNRLDILTEAYQARLTHIFKRTLKFGTLFKMMTSSGANVLHMPQRGRILPGMQADLAFWKIKDRGCIPYDEKNPFSLIGNMITHNGRTVRDLMINGKFVIKNRRHQLIDESKLLDSIQKRHIRMRRRSRKID